MFPWLSFEFRTEFAVMRAADSVNLSRESDRTMVVDVVLVVTFRGEETLMSFPFTAWTTC